ncbi:ABC transporter ATP-binding protein [Algoriphagus sp. CAU 1675]|uniref:ABC transporter ATP-binding protein n=1 Tax=Algoriphagus sp. CAU 1675 TaxID=3032597 RepID=UPI0023DCD044|nr:ABC transporter ATP-binding protein [Algoriphagus sp. CAU 1675]MDF2159228.1 ABC transporter ATP-binding protein [Algoriphagus sp. CAU 1675]
MKGPALIGKNLSLGYTQGKIRKEVLSGLNFSLNSGELTCLLGPNGVGKSTLVKSIMGRLEPWRGEILLNGKRIEDYPREELAREMAVVLTEPVLPAQMTVYQLVGLGRAPYTDWMGSLNNQDEEAVEEALSNTKIQYLRDQRLGEISDGQRQKALIARALAQDCDVVILDEPTAHLDLVNRYEVMYLLREIAQKEKKAILVVTHDLDIALETADRFWLMNCGTPLISGRPEDLVFSGEINELIAGGQFHFSMKRGRVEFQHPQAELEIEGPGDMVYWVQKALNKAGVKQIASPIRLVKDPFSIFYDGTSFDSLDDLIRFLLK